MQQTFDTDIMSTVIKSSEEILLSPEASDSIATFEELYKEMTEFRKQVLKKIEENALAQDPHFKSLTGDKVKLIYAERGSKYVVDSSLLEQLSSDYYSTETKYKPNTDAIDSYAKEHKGLPLGIISPERKKSLSVKLEK